MPRGVVEHEPGFPDDLSGLSADELCERLVSWLEERLPNAWRAAVATGDLGSIEDQVRLSATPETAAALGATGFAEATWPRGQGGLDLDDERGLAISQTLERYGLGRRFEEFVGRILAGPAIVEWGTDEQRQRHLLPLARGEEIWCQLFSEPGAGSDLAGLSTRATPRGAGWTVTGQKVWSSLAHTADFGLLLARTDPDQSKHRGITCFICDMHTAGITVRPLRQMTGEAEFNEVFLDDCVLPASALLGPIDEGWRVAISILAQERHGLSSTPGGGGELANRMHPRHAGADPTTVARRSEQLRILVEEQVLEMTNRRMLSAATAGAGRPVASVTKLSQSELNRRRTEAILGMQGPRGVSWTGREMPRDVYDFLHARADTIEGGTSEIQRNILGERVLGLPREPDPFRDRSWREVPH